jgi:hypothetical protein
MAAHRDPGPREKFKVELRSVFLRWWDESDLDEMDMRDAALEVIKEFCETSIGFEADPEFLKDINDDEDK